MRILLFVVALFMVCSACNAEQTILKGHIENYQGETLVISSNELPDLNDTLLVDVEGDFIYLLDNKETRIYTLILDGCKSSRVFVCIGAGDQVIVNLVLLPDKMLEYQFLGDRRAENEYMKCAQREIEESVLSYNSKIKALSFTSFKEMYNQKERKMQMLLDKIIDLEIKDRFAKWQHLFFQNRRLNYVSVPYFRNKTNRNVLDVDFNDFLKSLNLNDPNECDYGMICTLIQWYQNQDLSNKQENETLSFFFWLDRLVSNSVMKNEFATIKMKKVIELSGGESLDVLLECYNQICTDEVRCKQIAEQYKDYVHIYRNLMPGKSAPDFEMLNSKGEKVHLSDLKGKYLFIDIWATWCSPCRREISYMKKLQEYYTTDTRIALVSISIDTNVASWEDFLVTEKLTWAQYIVDSKNSDILDKEYRINGIPRFIFLDPAGKIISINAPRPSSDGIVEYLNENIAMYNVND